MAEINESKPGLELPISGTPAGQPEASQEDQADSGTVLSHLNGGAVPSAPVEAGLSKGLPEVSSPVPADEAAAKSAPRIPAKNAARILDGELQSAPVKRLPSRAARGTAKVTVRPSAVRSGSKTPEPRKLRSTSLATLKPTKVSSGTDANLVLVQSTNLNSKDSVMDMQSADFTAQIKETAASFQEKAKEVFQKSADTVDQLTGFSKGNAQAITEAGKILGSGINELVTDTVADCRSAFDVLTADAKEFAAISSPAEFFKFQANILGRNIGMALDFSSKNSEAVLKLAKEASAPLTQRITVAANALQSVG